MSDLYDKSRIWAFDDLSLSDQAKAEEDGFEPRCRYTLDEPTEQVAVCPFCQRSAINDEREWVKICPHFVFLASGYNGYEFVLPAFADFFWAKVDRQSLDIDADEIAGMIAAKELTTNGDAEALGVVTEDFDFGIDNRLTFGFVSDEFLRGMTKKA
jgi:hypothetical protein